MCVDNKLDWLNFMFISTCLKKNNLNKQWWVTLSRLLCINDAYEKLLKEVPIPPSVYPIEFS